MVARDFSPWRLRVPNAPNEIRTRVTGLKSRCPRPLDDGGSPVGSSRVMVKLTLAAVNEAPQHAAARGARLACAARRFRL